MEFGRVWFYPLRVIKSIQIQTPYEGSNSVNQFARKLGVFYREVK